MEELKLKIYELTYRYSQEEISKGRLAIDILELFDEFRNNEVINKLDEILSNLK